MTSFIFCEDCLSKEKVFKTCWCDLDVWRLNKVIMAHWERDLEFNESTVSLAEQWSVWSCVNLWHLRIMAFGVISFLHPFSLLTFLPLCFCHSTFLFFLVLFTLIRCHVSQLDSDLPFLSGSVKIISLLFLGPIFSFLFDCLFLSCTFVNPHVARKQTERGSK